MMSMARMGATVLDAPDMAMHHKGRPPHHVRSMHMRMATGPDDPDENHNRQQYHSNNLAHLRLLTVSSWVRSAAGPIS